MYFIPKVSCVENSSKITLEEKHSRARAVVGVHYSDSNTHSLSRTFYVEQPRLTHMQLHLCVCEWGGSIVRGCVCVDHLAAEGREEGGRRREGDLLHLQSIRV